jgi:hypothetical protein
MTSRSLYSTRIKDLCKKDTSDILRFVLVGRVVDEELGLLFQFNATFPHMNKCDRWIMFFEGGGVPQYPAMKRRLLPLLPNLSCLSGIIVKLPLGLLIKEATGSFVATDNLGTIASTVEVSNKDEAEVAGLVVLARLPALAAYPEGWS